MGSDEDPTDHAAVATSIFIAVAVYGVSERLGTSSVNHILTAFRVF
jgi:hypothetical protein